MVEERGHLLPRRRDLPRQRRRRLRRPPRADRADRLPRRARRDAASGSCPSTRRRTATTATTSSTSTAVDPRLGTLGDFVEMVRTARDRGIRVIADLVVNHTSDRPPVVPAARARPRLPVPRLLRVARREAAPRSRATSCSPTRRTSNWAWDEQAGPVLPAPLLLRPARPQRRQPGGARRDRADRGLLAPAGPRRLPRRRRAVPARAGRACRRARSRPARAGCATCAPTSAAAAATRSCSARSTCRRTTSARSSATRTATSWTWSSTSLQPGDVPRARPRGRRRRCATRSRRCREIPEECQWANFVRNHDELTLDKLTEDERDEVFAAFGPEETLQLYGRGLRRRLPTMLDGDQRASGWSTRSCSRCRDAGALLRRGDRHGREPRHRGPDGGALADAVVARAQRRLLARGADELVPAARRRRPLRARGASTSRTSAATRLAAELDGADDPPPPGVPRARLGRRHGARRGRPRGARPPRRSRRQHGRGAAQPRRGRPVDAAVVLDDAGDGAMLVDLFADDDVALDGGRARIGARCPTAPAGCACAGAGSGSWP